MRRFPGHFILILSILMLLCITASSAAETPESRLSQIAGVIHVHSTFSSGDHTIFDLVDMARQAGIAVLVITDHDRVRLEYGILPLRNVLKIHKELPSVLKAGADLYLETIDHVNQSQADVLVIPGVQSSPFYYWTGSPVDGTLTAYNYRKELLLIGMQNPADYRNLPILHNGFSIRYARQLAPRFLLFPAALILSLVLIRLGFRKTGFVLAAAGVLLGINNHPFKSSPFDPYGGDAGIAPYQEVIDYASRRSGLVFWTHPESNYAVEGRPYGPITLQTPHYPEAILESSGFTGFAALYGDNITMISPGQEWDMALLEYVRGFRDQPVWGIAESDFHRESGGFRLETYQTIFIVPEKTTEAVLDALRRGSCYAVLARDAGRLSIDAFNLTNAAVGRSASMGETLSANNPPVISGRISAHPAGVHPVRVVLIVNGAPVFEDTGNTPLDFEFRFSGRQWPPHAYCRLEADSPSLGRLISNPVFVKIRSPSDDAEN